MASANAPKPKTGKNPHAEELFASIEEERAEPRAPRPPLNAEMIESRRNDLIGLIAAGVKAVDAKHQPEAAAFGDALAKGFADLDEARTQRPDAFSGAQFYSPEARQAGVETAEVANGIRKIIGARAGNSEIADAIKTACGIGSELNADSPRDVKDVAFRQQKELSKPATQAFLKKRGVTASVHLEKLEPLLARLSTEIGKGLGTTVTKGDLTTQENAALWWIDVALDRAVVFFGEHGASAEAGKLESRVPKRHSKRAGDVSKTPDHDTNNSMP